MHAVPTLLLGIQTPVTAVQPADVAPATSLERIRQGLEQPPATIMIQSADPTCRRSSGWRFVTVRCPTIISGSAIR